MKKVLLFGAVLFGFNWAQAQDVGDAVRFSSDELDGTARFVSMGGAFGALGGDLSALKVNPAGSAVFSTNQAALSMDIRTYRNKTEFGDGYNSNRNNDVDLNQAGVVFVFDNNNESDAISRLSFGITYDRTNSFRNRYKALGNTDETIGDMFLDFAQGVPLDNFTTREDEDLNGLYDYLGNDELQTAYLGYETFLFDAVDETDLDNEDYVSNVGGDSFDHAYESHEKGVKSKVSLNGGLSINNKFYLGLNLNSHFIDYRRHLYYDEFIAGPSEINEINFDNYLDTRGTGFSFQIGGIAKLNDMFRVGVSYDSPTWYHINDETNQFLRTDSDEFGDAVANPEITNVYPRYHYRSPGKIDGSVAAVFGHSGLISVDYSYQDFSNNKFTSQGFGDLNADVGDDLQGVNSINIGGEYRLKDFTVRAGYRYADSPYKQDDGPGHLNGYSAGLGYDFGPVKLDFAYDLARRKNKTRLLKTGFSERAHIENHIAHYVLTAAFML